jgi:hypothetical protein
VILTPATVRIDLKCGKGAISQGEKCHVGQAQQVKPISKESILRSGFNLHNGKRLSNAMIRKLEREAVKYERATGKAVSFTPEQRAGLMLTRGTATRKLVSSQFIPARSRDLNNAIKASKGTQDPERYALRELAKRERFNRRVNAAVLAASIAAPLGYIAATRPDSVWARGFAP